MTVAEVAFADLDETVEVAPGTTLLRAAVDHGAPVGSHCGGVCACSKCHVYVVAGAEGLSPMAEDEEDMLDLAARGHDPDRSRLACQARLRPGARVTLRISEESFEQWLEDHPRERGAMLPRWLRRDP